MAFILQKWLAEKSLTVSSETSKSPNFILTVFCHFLSHSLAIFLSLCVIPTFFSFPTTLSTISLYQSLPLSIISFSIFPFFSLPLSPVYFRSFSHFLSLPHSFSHSQLRISLPLSVTVVSYLLYCLSLYPSHFESISFYFSLSHIPFSSFNFRLPFLRVFQHLCPLYLPHFPLSPCIFSSLFLFTSLFYSLFLFISPYCSISLSLLLHFLFSHPLYFTFFLCFFSLCLMVPFLSCSLTFSFLCM